MSRYNKTSLQPTRRSLIIDRDYLAHVAKWSYATRLIEQRHRRKLSEYRVLDVGCGVEAPLAAVIARHAFLAKGVPLTYIGVDVGPIRPLESPKWATYVEKTDVFEWSPSALADLVVCFEVIEHMPREDGLRLLQTLRQFCRKDGVVLIATPVKSRTLPHNHIYEYSLDELIAATVDAGLIVDRVFGTFMDVSAAKTLAAQDPVLCDVWTRLSEYYSSEALSCLYSPLFPQASKSVLLVARPDQASTTSSELSATSETASNRGLV